MSTINTLPASPSSQGGQSSVDSPILGPQLVTPISPAHSLNMNDSLPLATSAPGGESILTTTNNNTTQIGTGGVVRRKPTRRANTAERRATHNAVERQRRETLNGRFLVSS
jgi:hypothetical protein